MPRTGDVDIFEAPEAVIDPSLLAERVERVLPHGLATRKRMFGGITFLVQGNMLCCASKSGLMVRVGADAEEDALASPFARPCLGAGRRMAGFILVEPAGLTTDADLAGWIAKARAYGELLPPKVPSRKPASRSTSGG
jgi:TfoX/Sxy family transcriptional regulator of competence genes